MALQYSDHIETLRLWLQNTGADMLDTPEERTWCNFNIATSFSSQDMNDYFTSIDPNTSFQIQATAFADPTATITNIPVAQYQIESDNIFAINKMMVYRHQPRLKFYRDDLENKNVRTWTSLALSLAKLNLIKVNMGNASQNATPPIIT